MRTVEFLCCTSYILEFTMRTPRHKYVEVTTIEYLCSIWSFSCHKNLDVDVDCGSLLGGGLTPGAVLVSPLSRQPSGQHVGRAGHL